MSSAPTLQTVLGRVAISDGHALMHEHLAVGWLGHDLDPLAHRQREQELELVVRTLRELRERYHVSVVVDAAPADLGRDVALQARAAEASGVQVIAATGFDKLGRGLPFYFQQFTDEELEAFLVGELEEGVDATGIRCGVIKLGSTGVALSPQEVRDQRRRIVWSVFEIIRIRDGRIVSVRPRATTAPLLAVACSKMRSRPDSNRRSRP